jgi:hypothetical protein
MECPVRCVLCLRPIRWARSRLCRPLPLIGLYRAHRAAVNAFTETLALEVKPFGVRVHLVLPGRAPETKFGANAFPHLHGLDNPDYAPMIEKVIAGLRDTSGPVTYSSDVCEAIWKVATDSSSPLRVAAGPMPRPGWQRLHDTSESSATALTSRARLIIPRKNQPSILWC